jgi:hypothetical protein
MKTPAEKYGIDLDYLRRSKQSTPEQTLSWLAAAREFAFMPKKIVKKGEKGNRK